MYTFTDLNGFEVNLYFQQFSYIVEPKHVLAIIKKGELFLCTIHEKRGVEFPGGKVEDNETLQQAVIREVLEETNVTVAKVKEIGHYVVKEDIPFCKAIFIGTVEHEKDLPFLYETKGKLWLTLEQLIHHPRLSFYMKDDGMKRILEEVALYEQQHDFFKA